MQRFCGVQELVMFEKQHKAIQLDHGEQRKMWHEMNLKMQEELKHGGSFKPECLHFKLVAGIGPRNL